MEITKKYLINLGTLHLQAAVELMEATGKLIPFFSLLSADPNTADATILGDPAFFRDSETKAILNASLREKADEIHAEVAVSVIDTFVSAFDSDDQAKAAYAAMDENGMRLSLNALVERGLCRKQDAICVLVESRKGLAATLTQRYGYNPSKTAIYRIGEPDIKCDPDYPMQGAMVIFPRPLGSVKVQ